jgi:cobaltochelatase CobS
MSARIDFDADLIAAIENEYATMHGKTVLEATTELVTDNKDDAEAVTLPPVPEWPGHKMFSAVFGRVPTGKRDIPVPQFTPDDWPDEARPMIPCLPPYWEHNVDTMYAIAVAVYCGDTTLLMGPTGSGKTSALIAFCAVCCIPAWLTSCYRRMESTEFIGSSSLRADPETGANVTEYNPTQLVHSLWHGGMAIIDEAFRSPTLMTIQSLLESKHTIVLAEADGLDESKRVITAPKGRWWVMLTDNTCGTGDDSGSYDAEVQDLSTLDRITTTVHVGYNLPATELAILRRAVPEANESRLREMVSTANLIRDAFMQGKVLQTMSMRALLSWAQKASICGSVDYGYQRAYHAKLDPTSAAISHEVWHQVFGRDLAS